MCWILWWSWDFNSRLDIPCLFLFCCIFLYKNGISHTIWRLHILWKFITLVILCTLQNGLATPLMLRIEQLIMRCMRFQFLYLWWSTKCLFNVANGDGGNSLVVHINVGSYLKLGEPRGLNQHKICEDIPEMQWWIQESKGGGWDHGTWNSCRLRIVLMPLHIYPMCFCR